MGKTQSSDMKTAFLLLLLSVVGLGLVCAELHGEDQYTEDANVVAVDDSAAAMDEADEMDDSRRSQEHRRRDTARWHSFKRSAKAQFDFDGLLEANVIVSQTHWEQNTNTARWSAKFNEFDDDICPGGELNWHVHEYPVSETASNIRTMNTQIKSFNTQTTQIESFNKQTAQIVYFAPNGVNGVTGAVTASTPSAGELKLDWDLAGLEASTTASGSNGIHIHYGKSCDSEATVQGDAPVVPGTTTAAKPAGTPSANKGHYYVPTDPDVLVASEDPWANVKYISDVAGKSTGSVTIPGSSLGAAHFSAFSRVVIVHDPTTGAKIGCGVLAPSNTVMGTATASTTSAGELKLDWDLAGLTPDTPSTGPGKNGIHIHYGRSCDSETTIKGVFYDPASQFNPTTHDP